MFHTVSSFLLRISIIVACVLSVSFPVNAAQVSNSGPGWKTYLSTGTPNYAVYDNAEEACYRQYQSWVAPHGVYGPMRDSADWWIKYCNWTGATPYATIIEFICPSGSRMAIERCVSETGLNDPDTCNCGEKTEFFGQASSLVGDPVDIVAGRVVETVRDFQTADGLLYVDRLYSGSSFGQTNFIPTGVARGAGPGWQFSFAPQINLTASFGTDTSVNMTLPDDTNYRLYYNTVFSRWELHDASVRPVSDIKRFTVEIVGGFPPGSLNNVTASSQQFIIRDTVEDITYTFFTYADPNDPNGRYTRGVPSSVRFGADYQWTYSYGTKKELESITDSFGRTLEFEWRLGRFIGQANYPIQIASIALPDGTGIEYDYEATFAPNIASDKFTTDRLAAVRHVVSLAGSGPSNVISEETYDYEDTRFPALITGRNDARGIRYATWTYDSQGRVASSSNGAGENEYTFTYTPAASGVAYRTVTNPLGKVETYTYAVASRTWNLTQRAKASSTDSPSSTASNTYSSKQLSQKTDEEGFVTKYTRDATGRPTRIVEAFGQPEARIIDYVWNADQRLTQLVAPGLTTDYDYDLDGRLTSVTETDTTSHSLPYSTNGQTRVWAYTYTGEGLIASVDGPLAGSGDTTAYTYDADGYLATSTNEVGNVTNITSVDDLGRVLEFEDANGIVTELTYTATGFLETITVDPLGIDALTTIGYNEVGDVTSIVRGDGSEYGYNYDDARRLTSIHDVDYNWIFYEYDAMGNRTQTIATNSSNELVYKQDATFDELGRLLTQIGVNDATWHYAYDKTSNLTRATDPRWQYSDYSYNGLRQLTEILDEEGNETLYDWTGGDQIASVEDDNSVETTYVRNGWGEIIQESSPDIGTIVYERNKLGLVTNKVDGRSIETDYAYDDAGRLTSISYPLSSGENVTLAYDDQTGGNLGANHLTSFTDATGDTTRVYNALGLLASETNDALGTNKTTEYSYDDAGNLIGMVYPSGRIVTFYRYGNGKIGGVYTQKTALDSAETIVDNVWWYPFTDTNMMNMDFGNGLNLFQIFRQDYRHDQLSIFDAHSTPVDVQYYGYVDDLNLTHIWNDLDHDFDEYYWYSNNHRLSNAEGPWGAEVFTYDGVGNITTRSLDDGLTVTEDEFDYTSSTNRMASIDRNSSLLRTYTYDLAGNIATKAQAGTTTTYTYNYANRMAEVSIGLNQVGEYVYNARNQLTVRIVTNSPNNGTTVYFYDDAGHVIAEYDGGGTLKREYIWFGEKPIAVIDPGSPSTTYYVHTDHLNRAVAMSDANKDFVASYVWNAYGGLSTYSGTGNIDLRFPGQLMQAETGLHYNWFRHYDPETGRYTQPDPLGLEAGTSRYAYSSNDPLQTFDPTGLASINGFGPHALRRMMERGITRRAVEDAIDDPLRIMSQPNGNMKYVGAMCTVVLSPNGWVVTIMD
jgi:RHS repeat-associated protein